jgi:hypothetical protein
MFMSTFGLVIAFGVMRRLAISTVLKNVDLRIMGPTQSLAKFCPRSKAIAWLLHRAIGADALKDHVGKPNAIHDDTSV